MFRLSSNILKLYEGEFFNPDYGHSIKKNFNKSTSEESLLKFIIIELFISNLNEEELKEYDDIEDSFNRFKARQSEGEKRAAALLARLSKTMHVPSSVTSSDCGSYPSEP